MLSAVTQFSPPLNEATAVGVVSQIMSPLPTDETEHQSFSVFLVEQVQNHHKLIKGTSNKLLKADGIKLSWEETALFLEELLPKAGNTSIKSKHKSKS